MKNNLLKKLFAVLLGIVCIAGVNAQSLNISPGGSTGYTCISANNTGNTGTTFSVNENDLRYPAEGVSIHNVIYNWTAAGGIEITSGAASSSVSIKSLSNGTTYGSGYSKYAKGKLNVNALVTYKYERTYSKCNGTDTTSYFYFNVSYNTSTEIRKIFDVPDVISNAIVGPVCLSPGDSVTYSVAPWVSLYDISRVGFDDYVWTVPQGLNSSSLYYSADRSSVTFKVGTNIQEGQQIAVTLGACNTTTQNPTVLTLNATPDAPYLVGNTKWVDSICIPLSAATYTLTIANPQPNVTYTWEKLSGWYATDTYQLGFDYTIKLNPQDDNKYIRLRAKSKCSEETYDLQLNRSFEASVNTISTQYDNCLPKNTDVTFSVKGASSGIAMKWGILRGDSTWKISDSTSPKPTIHTGFGTAEIFVVASCGDTLKQTFKIQPDAPKIISGRTCLANQTTMPLNYTIEQEVLNAEKYQWSYPAGWGYSGSDNSRTITLIPDASSIGTIKVKSIGCSESKWGADSLKVRMTPNTPGAITGDTCLVNASTSPLTYSVTKSLNAEKYQWSYPAAWRVNGTDSTNNISLIPNGTTGGQIKVRAISCDTSAWSEVLNIHVTPARPTGFTGSACLDRNSTSALTYSVNTDANANTYKWEYPQGWHVVNGTDSTGHSISLTPNGTNGGVIRVRAIGCDLSDWLPKTVNMAPDTIKGIEFDQAHINLGTTDTITCSVLNPDLLANYDWDSSAFGTIIANNNTSIVVVTDGSAGAKNIRVRVAAKGDCNPGVWKNKAIDPTATNLRLEYFPMLTMCFITATGNVMDVPTGTFKWWISVDGNPAILLGSNYAYMLSSESALTSQNIKPSDLSRYVVFCDVINNDGCRVRFTYGNGPHPTNYNSLRSAIISGFRSAEVKEKAILKVSPNPASDVIYGYLNDNGTDELTIRLFTIGGRVVFTKSTTNRLFSIDSVDLPAGNYILMVTSASGKYQEQVIIKK